MEREESSSGGGNVYYLNYNNHFKGCTHIKIDQIEYFKYLWFSVLNL